MTKEKKNQPELEGLPPRRRKSGIIWRGGGRHIFPRPGEEVVWEGLHRMSQIVKGEEVEPLPEQAELPGFDNVV